MPVPSPKRPVSDPDDVAACRAALRTGSRTFFAASHFLPGRVRDAAIVLYAFCREADDVVDLGEGGPGAVRALQRRLDRIYDGTPIDNAADRAMAHVVERFAIPKAILDALLEGLAWDAAGRRYADLGELYAYAVRVAGTVGAMMAILMGARSPSQIARASELGIAMQLSNIARDVGEDARAGRLYLPMQWLDEAGIDPQAFLAEPSFSAPLGQVVEQIVDAAEQLYRQSSNGIARLPFKCRPGIYAARFLYSEIGREVARSGHDSVSRRAVVPARRKAGLLVKSITAVALPAGYSTHPAIAQAQFLVDAVVATPHPAGDLARRPARLLPRWQPAAGVVRIIEIFERLERQDRAARLGDGPWADGSAMATTEGGSS